MALIICRECKKEISSSLKKCVHCNAKVIKEIACSECGKIYDETEKRCPNCGNKNKKINKKVIIGIGIVLMLLVGIIVFILLSDSNGETIVKEDYSKKLRRTYANKCGYSSLCELSADNKSLTVDSNPYDWDDYSNPDAFEIIQNINYELGFNDSLYDRMLSTRALDGTQSEENEHYKVTWTYHPDKGIDIVYSVKY